MSNTKILRKFTSCLLFGLSLVLCQITFAQEDRESWRDRFRGDRGDRGDRDRGGFFFRGPGGDRGDSRGGFGGDRGGFSFRGGPPGGGFPGGGPPGGSFGPPSPERMFGFMDRNGDGQVTAEEAPSWMRDRLERSGVDLRKGLSQSDMSRAFERMRQEREESGGGFGDRGPESARSEGGSQGRSSSGPQTAGPYVSKSRGRVTADLPLSYVEGDLDGDGQIGFYEWRKWRRNQTETFFAMDANSDGFLTPKELMATPAGSSGTSGRPATLTAGTASNSSVIAPPSESRPVERTTSSSSSDADGVYRSRGESMFRGLDRDRDGSISPEEWARSSRLRPMFENGGVDLSRPMSRETFVETYVKLSQNS